ncbi:Mnn4, partial [Ophiophagus hannah]
RQNPRPTQLGKASSPLLWRLKSGRRICGGRKKSGKKERKKERKKAGKNERRKEGGRKERKKLEGGREGGKKEKERRQGGRKEGRKEGNKEGRKKGRRKEERKKEGKEGKERKKGGRKEQKKEGKKERNWRKERREERKKKKEGRKTGKEEEKKEGRKEEEGRKDKPPSSEGGMAESLFWPPGRCTPISTCARKLVLHWPSLGERKALAEPGPQSHDPGGRGQTGGEGRGGRTPVPSYRGPPVPKAAENWAWIQSDSEGPEHSCLPSRIHLRMS